MNQKRAVTLVEILIAVTVMVVAMVPLFGIMSRQTVETDRNAAQAFAITKATEILNAMLDNVTFASIREGNPGYIKVSDLANNDRYEDYSDAWAKKMSKMLFNNETPDSNGYKCRGIVTDSKGISYLIHMRVEDVYSTIKLAKPERIKVGERYGNIEVEPEPLSEMDEVSFAFLKNPSMLTYSKWTQDFAESIDDRSKPLTELDLPGAVSESPINIYEDENIDSINSNNKYGYKNPTAERYTPRMVMAKVPYETTKECSWCPFKRLIVQVQWNLEQAYYSNPESDKGNVQRIHLMAIKGDID